MILIYIFNVAADVQQSWQIVPVFFFALHAEAGNECRKPVSQYFLYKNESEGKDEIVVRGVKFLYAFYFFLYGCII